MSITNYRDKVHNIGMLGRGGTYLTVDGCDSPDDHIVVDIEPPLRVVFDGNNTDVVIGQGSLAVRYTLDELHRIGEENPLLGIKRVIGAIAAAGNLVLDTIKPLHPDIIVSDVVPQRELMLAPAPEAV